MGNNKISAYKRFSLSLTENEVAILYKMYTVNDLAEYCSVSPNIINRYLSLHKINKDTKATYINADIVPRVVIGDTVDTLVIYSKEDYEKLSKDNKKKKDVSNQKRTISDVDDFLLVMQKKLGK